MFVYKYKNIFTCNAITTLTHSTILWYITYITVSKITKNNCRMVDLHKFTLIIPLIMTHTCIHIIYIRIICVKLRQILCQVIYIKLILASLQNANVFPISLKINVQRHFPKVKKIHIRQYKYSAHPCFSDLQCF